jgi:hypothetical protein
MTDKKIKVLLAIYIATAVFILVAVLTRFIHPLPLSLLNILSAGIPTACWLRRFLIYPHRPEQRELLFVGIELICIAVSLVFVFTLFNTGPMRIVQYLILILHVLAAAGLLAFFMLFKIKKLL